MGPRDEGDITYEGGDYEADDVSDAPTGDTSDVELQE